MRSDGSIISRYISQNIQSAPEGAKIKVNHGKDFQKSLRYVPQDKKI